MHASQLEKYRLQLHSRLPLIGAWLQEQALRSLAADGSAEAIRILEEAVSDGDHEALGTTAAESLGQLAEHGNVAAQEALCRLVTYDDHELARNIVFAAGYVPHEESQRALFYFLTDQWDKYESLDFDHRLLREAYDAGDPPLRSRIAAKARQAGRLEWVEVVSGGKQGRRLAVMTDEEWRAALNVLERGQRWDDLWRLAQEAPPRWSAPILRLLHKSRWQVREDDRAGCKDLIRLAKRFQTEDLELAMYPRATLQGHSHEVRCLAITPSGRILASGSADHTVRLWSLPDGRALQTLEGHAGWVNCLAFSRDGRVLASAGRDHRICLWRLPRGRLLQKLKGHTQTVFCLAISPNAKVLASGSSDNTVRLWSLSDGQLLRTLKGHEGGISCLAISPDGQCLASGSADGTVRLWSLPKGRSLARLDGHYGVELDGALCLAISADSRLLASGGMDSTVRLWSLPDGAQLRALEAHFGSVSSLAISPDSRLLIAGGADHAVQFWRLPSGQLVKTLETQTNESSSLAMSPDGRLLATTSGSGMGFDHTVRLYRLPDGRVLRTLPGHSHCISCLVMSPDSRLLASGSGDSTIRLWTADLARLLHLPVAQASLQDLEWIQDTLGKEGISATERNALEFIATLIRWRRRSDILVGEAAPRVIELGEFDIEIEA